MHCVQLLLVEAETHQEAITTAESKLNEVGDGFWSDWWEVGGRWSGIFGVGEANAYQYSTDKDEAEKFITEFLEYRKTHAKELLGFYEKEKKSIVELIDSHDPNAYNFDEMMLGFYLSRIGKILSNDWCSDSGVYDLEGWSANLTQFRERVATHPEKQFLVAVDFHH